MAGIDGRIMKGRTPDELLEQCRDKGLRATKSLRAILQLLCATDAPLSIQQCAENSPALARADTVTLYRLFERLEGIGVVRRIGLHERAAHYVLADSLRHRHFVCCTRCGKVQALSQDCTIGHLEEHVAQDSGYVNLYHELVFYGSCPQCA